MQRAKIEGALYGAAYGDSFGAITEFRSRDDILQAFPEGYTDYTESISLITKGIVPGTVTDDFGSSCYFMKAILKHDGHFDRDIAVEAVLDWSKDEVVFAKYAGQNTKSAMERLKQGNIIDEGLRARHFGRQNTNGGAMKAAPMGLLAREDHQLAIRFTKDLCWPTHYNGAAVSGACAIACAVCEAQKEGATVGSIIEQAIAGARQSRIQLDEEGFGAFGPYVDRRIGLAVDLGRQAKTEEEVYRLLEEMIGTGISVQESVPAVFAIMAAQKGDLEASIRCAANAGGDTDTISSMTGAILGGLHGAEAIRPEVIDRIQSCNQFLQLKETVEQYTNLILSKER
ncbi:MAG: ADP-ribosylglycohydrolase family protein [Lachnospiraceae bacterium]|nr:ADP-ribosylglycohydrolase family protein [Lachnospiraceae bacterium]